MNQPASIDEYIGMFPQDIQKKLRQLRAVIKKTAPDAIETISYKMPAYKLNGPLVYFAVFKNHIGFFPTPGPIAALKKELIGFHCSKGAIQFPLDQPVPTDLVKMIVKYRIEENGKDKKVKAIPEDKKRKRS